MIDPRRVLDDHFHDECGVFGVFGHAEAAKLAYLGLYALQHRGQESAGIVSSDGVNLHTHRAMGEVEEIFKPDVIAKLPGNSAIGHTRYSTAGDTSLNNCQPILIDCNKGKLALGFKQLRFHGHEVLVFQVLDRDEVEFPFKEPKVFEDLEVEMVKDWLTLIPKKAPDTRVIIHPGNDDKFVLDDVLKNSPHVIFAEESVVYFDDRHEAACVGWSNPTPWHSPRECTEEQLLEKLETTISRLQSIATSCFCFHVPPYNSTIDMAPKLDENLRPVYEGGRPAFIPVGSTSVRKVIEKYQPLLGLHGHIHESPGLVKVGKTQCVNPGSEYSEGILRAYIVELEDGKVSRLQRLEG